MTNFKNREFELIELKVPSIKYPFFIRLNTTDSLVFNQVFQNKEYDFKCFLEPTYIIDAGANIGLAAIYFANKFKNANIICLEPDENNFLLLKRNTEKYSKIKAVKSAIWHRKCFVEVKDYGYGEWGYMIEESYRGDTSYTSSVSVDDVMKENEMKIIDIMKMDIEGSEKEVFSENYENWLPKTRYIVIELHDSMRKGSSKAFFKAITKYNFSFSVLGENLMFTNEDINPI